MAKRENALKFSENMWKLSVDLKTVVSCCRNEKGDPVADIQSTLSWVRRLVKCCLEETRGEDQSKAAINDDGTDVSLHDYVKVRKAITCSYVEY